VFSAPTSAGKTIVYEILALRRLITTGKPFLLVLPTVMLCQQKVRMRNSACRGSVHALQDHPIMKCPGSPTFQAETLDLLLSLTMDKTVKKFFGGANSRGAIIDSATGAIICTIEKANQLVGRMMVEGSLSELGAIVIDELHMVADDDR
jgi:DNA polymerase theta